MSSVKPTLIIGLGEFGKKISDLSISKLARRAPIVYSNVIADYSIDENFTFTSTHGYVEPIKIENLINSYHNQNSNVVKHNYNKIIELEQEFRSNFERLIRKLKEVSKERELIKHGYNRSLTQVLIVSSLFDPIGSSLFLPILKFLNKGSKDILINLVLLLPNVRAQEDDKQIQKEKFRALASISELDKELSELQLNGMVFLIGGENENENIVDSFEELCLALSNFIYLMISDKIFTDSSFSSILKSSATLTDRIRHYSSFGFSSIIYSLDQFYEAILNRGIMEVLDNPIKDIKKRESNEWEHIMINSDIKKFITESELKDYIQFLEYGDSSEPIYQKMRPDSDLINEDIDVDEFNKYIKRLKQEYEINEYNESLNTLFHRKTKLLETTKEKIKTFLNQQIDNVDKGVPYADAFLNTLVDKKSKFIREKSYLEKKDNLLQIKTLVVEFFEEYLKIHKLKSRSTDIQKEIDKKRALQKEKQSMSNSK